MTLGLAKVPGPCICVLLSEEEIGSILGLPQVKCMSHVRA